MPGSVNCRHTFGIGTGPTTHPGHQVMANRHRAGFYEAGDDCDASELDFRATEAADEGLVDAMSTGAPSVSAPGLRAPRAAVTCHARSPRHSGVLGRGRIGYAVRVSHPPATPTTTPDGRYIVVRGRLWRASNPTLSPEHRKDLVQQLMDARRALRRGIPAESRAAARAQVEMAKRGLGERGPPWWTDGAPDYNRHLVKNTPYAAWFEALKPDAG